VNNNGDEGTGRKLIFQISHVLSWVCVVAIGLMMFLTTGDVVGRYFFNRPLMFATDVTELLTVLAVFMGVAEMQLIKGHVRVELLISRLSIHNQAILDTLTSFFATGIFALMAWQLGKRAWISLLNPDLYTTPTIEIPIGPFVLVAAIGSLMLSLVLLTDFFFSLGRALRCQVGK
jgi:TRAP-type C4-dicarboxylate transport system permease small subunit